jgi:small conductance mechanosensitive channel
MASRPTKSGFSIPIWRSNRPGRSTLLREDAQFASRILDDFELAGVDKWGDSAVIVRGRFRVAPLEQWNVRREFLRRLKSAFDAHGIEIPFPQMTLHAGPSLGANAAAPAAAAPARSA